MPRNKSERNPEPVEAQGVDPDFYKLLRIYAEMNVARGNRANAIRERALNWGITLHNDGFIFWQNFGSTKQDTWFSWKEATKRAYVADYMDYLYAAQ